MTTLLMLLWASLHASLASPWPSLPAPQDERQFVVDLEQLPFDALEGLDTDRRWGVHRGAGFRIEVPAVWNGDLVMYAHGFRGTGNILTVSNPPLRRHLIEQGYAWAASSYTKNFYDVRAGVESTNALVRYFQKRVERPERVFILGDSMGGHIATAAVEQFPNATCFGRGERRCRTVADLLGRLVGGVRYAGAVPTCGVMGDRALFDYFGDFARAAEALAGVESTFPPPADYDTTVLPQVIASLFEDDGAGFPNRLTSAGRQLKALTQMLSGGPRPTFEAAYPLTQTLLFSFAAADGTVSGVVGGNVYDNATRVYQLDTLRELTEAEATLNASILRVAKNPQADPRRLLTLERIPELTGRLSVPVVSMHTLGDLFVPFSMQQIYARRVATRGRDQWLVTRAIRDTGHCTFTLDEYRDAFDDMVHWATTGIRPAGDPILDPSAVAAPDFGCRFTTTDRVEQGVARCP